MNYLLDTDVIIDYIKKKKTLFSLPYSTDNYILSVITYSELLYGATKKEEQIITDLFTELAVEYIPVDRTIIECYVSLRKALETKGEQLADFDLLIAATAMTTHATLVTRNKKHFQRIPNLILADENN